MSGLTTTLTTTTTIVASRAHPAATFDAEPLHLARAIARSEKRTVQAVTTGAGYMRDENLPSGLHAVVGVEVPAGTAADVSRVMQ